MLILFSQVLYAKPSFSAISTIKESLNLALQKEGEPSGTFQIESRIKVLNNSMLELVQFITKTKSDDERYDDQFKVISDEIKKLQEILNTQDKKATAETHINVRLKELYSVLESESLMIRDFDNILVKQIIDTIKVRAKDKIIIIFNGGIEVEEKLGGG